MELHRALDELFPPERTIDSSGIDPATLREASLESNPFLSTTPNGEQRFQSISGDFLLLIDRATPTERRYYMVSPKASSAALLPRTSQPINTCHRHDYLEVVCMLEGELDFDIEGERQRYQAADCSIINQRVWHQEGAPETCTVAYLSLRPSFLEGLRLRQAARAEDAGALQRFLRRNMTPSGEVDYLDFLPLDAASAAAELGRNLTALVRELVGQQAGYLDMLNGYVTRILHLLETPEVYACRNVRLYRSGTDDLVEQTVAYVQAQRRRVTREELAAALRHNGNYVSDVFQRRTGITLGAYVRSVCMQEAARLLLNTSLPVSAIASRLGYENKTGFYAHFKAAYGLTPAAYRAAGR